MKFNKFQLSYKTQLHLFLLPYLLGILILVIIPAILSFGIAFFRYDGLSAPVWVGNLNFILAYNDELFNLSIQNSVALVLLPVPLRVFGAFLMARTIAEKRPFSQHLPRHSSFYPVLFPEPPTR